MEFNTKNIVIAVAATAVFVTVGVVIAKVLANMNEKVEAEAEDTADLESAKKASLAINAGRFEQAMAGVTMDNLFEADGRLNPKVRAALTDAIYFYVNNIDLNERQNRKHLSFLDGLEDAAVRVEMAKVAKRIIGIIYKGGTETPDVEFTPEYVDSLFD